MVARLNIHQTEANLIEQGFNIFGHSQADQIVNCVLYDSHYFPEII